VDTRTRGIDIVGSWRTELSGGGLDLTLGCNYDETDILNTRPNLAILAQNGSTCSASAARKPAAHDRRTARQAHPHGNWMLGHWACASHCHATASSPC
jgi:hypothetical protein